MDQRARSSRSRRGMMLSLRLAGGGHVDDGNTETVLQGDGGRNVADEWEIAEGFDDIVNTFTYFRNKRYGHVVEFNQVRCGGFRYTCIHVYIHIKICACCGV